MRLILVDPDAGERARTARELRAAFPEADLIEISTVAELDRALERGRPDAVLTENRLDRLDGIGILGAVRRRFPHAAVLMVTAQRGERLAAGAMKAGFADILPKTEIDHLPAAVQESIYRARLRQAQEDEVLELNY